MELLTPDEVAIELRVALRTVQNWLAKGQIRGVKLPGGAWRVERREVDRILMTGERGGE